MTTRKRRRYKHSRLAPLCLSVALLALAAAALWLWKNQPLPGEDVTVPDYVEQEFLTVNEWSRPGTPLEAVNGVVIHYVGNPNTTAKANRNYFESLSTGELDTYASSHFIVGLEGEVLQCVPLTEVSYASNTRNGDTIAVEVCHPDETGEFSDVTYARTVELTAWLCREFDLDPAAEVIRHYDVTGKVCPRYYVENPAEWERFLVDVTTEMERRKTA